MCVRNQLMQRPGVGKKVADCVALFSLNQVAAIPVDTLVWETTTGITIHSCLLQGRKA